VNSREKGKRGERQWRDELRAHGYAARRGQQFAGSPESPDVVCDDLDWAHFEVKFVERLNVYDAMAQAQRDCGACVPFLSHRRSNWPWLVTITGETLFKFLRGELPPERTGAVRQEPSKQPREKEQQT
jgi:Holliday junction resolvase